MNLYDKIDNAKCEIPESFCMTASQAVELAKNNRGYTDLVYIAFKFGYMQGQRAATFKTNKANEKRTESESDRLRRHIYEMVGKIGSERRLRRIYNIVHVNFLNDGLEGLNERKD